MKDDIGREREPREEKVSLSCGFDLGLANAKDDGCRRSSTNQTRSPKSVAPATVTMDREPVKEDATKPEREKDMYLALGRGDFRLKKGWTKRKRNGRLDVGALARFHLILTAFDREGRPYEKRLERPDEVQESDW